MFLPNVQYTHQSKRQKNQYLENLKQRYLYDSEILLQALFKQKQVQEDFEILHQIDEEQRYQQALDKAETLPQIINTHSTFKSPKQQLNQSTSRLESIQRLSFEELKLSQVEKRQNELLTRAQRSQSRGLSNQEAKQQIQNQLFELREQEKLRKVQDSQELQHQRDIIEEMERQRLLEEQRILEERKKREEEDKKQKEQMKLESEARQALRIQKQKEATLELIRKRQDEEKRYAEEREGIVKKLKQQAKQDFSQFVNQQQKNMSSANLFVSNMSFLSDQ